MKALKWEKRACSKVVQKIFCAMFIRHRLWRKIKGQLRDRHIQNFGKNKGQDESSFSTVPYKHYCMHVVKSTTLLSLSIHKMLALLRFPSISSIWWEIGRCLLSGKHRQ